MAARSTGPFKLHNPWVKIGWLSAAGVLVVGIFLGFVLLGREQQKWSFARSMERFLLSAGNFPRCRTCGRARAAVAHADASRLDP